MKDVIKVCKPLIFTSLTVFCIFFIFSRSLQAGNESGEESGKILELLNAFARVFGFENLFSHTFVRKSAHFTEFAILSVFAFFMYRSYKIKEKTVVFVLAITYTLIAIIDEIFQHFVPGRACMITDVLIDFSGGTFGLLLCLLFSVILTNVKTRNMNDDSGGFI